MTAHLRIFLSSPGDVAEERQLAREAIAELQREPQFEAARLEAVSWDDPQGRTPLVAQLDPQTAVERGLPKPSECDVVVGVFWARMGSPLPIDTWRKNDGSPYLSGTEYELEDAFGAEPGPDVLLYRRSEDPRWGGRDPDLAQKKAQLDRIDEYVKLLKAAKRYVGEYSGPSDFKDGLKNDLRKVLAVRLTSKPGDQSVPPVPEVTKAPIWRGSPYPGLRAFVEREGPVFFGRGPEIDALLRKVRQFDSWLLAVIGASGSGKSSLVRAGLIPRLRANALEGSKDWVILTFKPGDLGDDPFLPLATELQRLLPPHRQAPAAKDLAAALTERPGDIVTRGSAALPADRDWARLVLFVDQFEELLTLAAPDSRPKFIELLAHAAADPKLFVVITMRAEFLAEASRDERLAQLLREGTFPLAPPGPAALVEAIRRPAEQAGVEVPQDLVDAILNDVGAGPGALPLVAFCLSELWPQDEGAEPRLTLDAYNELGRLRGAIERRAGQILDTLGKAERDALPDLFQHLIQVNPDGTATRRRASKVLLEAQPSLSRLVSALVDGRLLLTSGDGADAQIEASHEALFDGWAELRHWLGINRGLLLVRGRVLADQQRWEREGRDDELLLPPGRRLEEAVDLLERRPDLLLEGMAEFIELSQQRADAAEARRQEELARESRHIARRAREQTVTGDAVTAMLLALEALPRDPSQPERPLVSEAVVALDEAYRRAREFAVLLGHEDGVYSAAFSPDGLKVVTASLDHSARLWDVASGNEKAVLQGHEGPLYAAAFSPDSSQVVTASEDRSARLWDAASGKELEVLQGHEGRVYTAAFSPDGSQVVTASDDRRARLWDAQSGKELVVLQGHEAPVYSAAFSPDGSKVVTASADYSARLWDAASGEPLAVLHGHKDVVYSAAFSPDGSKVVTASNDNTARLWDAVSSKELAVHYHYGRVVSAAFSPDGSQVMTASWDRSARLWDVASGHGLAWLRGHEDRVISAAFSPDGSQVVTASADHSARLWDAVTGRELAVLQGHEDRVISGAFSPDGSKVATASFDRSARLWHAASGEPPTVLQGHEANVSSAAFSPDGSKVVTASSDRTARLWDAQSGKELVALQGHQANVSSAAFSPDGSKVVTASSDRSARLWDAQSGKELGVLQGHEGPVNSAAFSPDGAKVVSASWDDSARLWGAASGEPLAVLHGHKDVVYSAAFSPDGSKVVTASNDNTARLWDARSGRELAVLQGHEGAVRSAAFSPDGSKMVIASEDRSARLWDTASGKELAVLQGHEAQVRSAAFSSDGSKIVTASEDRTARIWRAFRSVEELVAAARARLPRQLTPEQRRKFFLPER